MTAVQANDVQTRRQYLSGTGCDDMVEWDFRCSDGRNSGQWTKIGVPSCWELQGFGTYQYGMRFYGKATPEGIADEKGTYRYEFSLPAAWQGREVWLVFEAAMTEARVSINGRKAGSGVHHGGFTRFQFNVSDRVFFGSKKNRLEVEVLKESTIPQVNLAERRADYWNFGGLWRPVFIVSKPVQNIQRVAVDAGMDGRFRADAYLNRAVPGGTVDVEIRDGKSVVGRSEAFRTASDVAKIDFRVKNPKLWTAETPHLYTAVFTLRDAKGKVLHEERQRFGFRTIEYRHSYNGDNGDGLYINGRRVIIKGVNRHSFRPESGRTLSKQKNIEDVLLIKSMNMNAVRLSHYPADPEFLDACDSLGLYVENELPGWHWAHETVVGSQLAEEMVTRDVNHPSIVFWSNGNEGGFNYDIEPVFTRLDPQHRVVLYPWANRNGFETKHYRSWGETAEYMRQKEIFMPTEFLHGLYDGGHGAGLKDYWELMMSNPRCAGGFLWDLMDQGVVRTDQGGIIDCMGNFASDGIVGPHMEKEGSYYTIKDVWSPVQPDFSHIKDVSEGRGLPVGNRYDFTNLSACSFKYRYLRMPEAGADKVSVVSEGMVKAPDVAPWCDGVLPVPVCKGAADALELTVKGADGREVMTWCVPLNPSAASGERSQATQQTARSAASDVRLNDDGSVQTGAATYYFSKENGRLTGVQTSGRHYSLANGPRFVAAKRSDRSQDGFYNHDDKEAFDKKTQYTEYADQGSFNGMTLCGDTLVVRYGHGSLQEVRWHFASDRRVEVVYRYVFNGVVDLMGVCFDYPEQLVRSKQWVGNGPYRVWQNRLQGPQYGLWQNAYNDPVPGESFDYPEFKGYFSNVSWLQLSTTEGHITLSDMGGSNAKLPYVGVYQPRDGRDKLLYDLPQTGLSVLQVIPAVRNKVNTTDLNGPSAQPVWAVGAYEGTFTLTFE